MELRKHQIKAIDQIRETIRQGTRSMILAAPCAFGKTITAAHILKSAQDKGNRAIFIADRIKLVDQTENAFEGFGIDYGVQMSNHYKTNEEKLIQLASVQTLTRRMEDTFDYDLAIVDEAHTNYETIKKAMKLNPKCIFIGMTATPYSKGLGLYYKQLIVPITTRELLDAGYLTPIQYYGGTSVDLSNIKRRALATGGSDYDPIELSTRIEKDKDKLSGDIVKNYIAHGEGKMAIAFSPSINHSKYLAELFIHNGIPAAHIDGYMDNSERKKLYALHESHEIQVLCCSRLLGVGYDNPEATVLIDCFPTKSTIVYQQRLGRITRLHENKPHAIYLDHAGNTQQFGFYEDLVPYQLHNKETYNEKKLVKRDKKENKPNVCPECSQIFEGIKCECGYTIDMKRAIRTDKTMLKKLNQAERNNILESIETKARWYNQLKLLESIRGYKKGFAEKVYRRKFSVYPNDVPRHIEVKIDPDVQNYVRSCLIAFSKYNISP